MGGGLKKKPFMGGDGVLKGGSQLGLHHASLPLRFGAKSKPIMSRRKQTYPCSLNLVTSSPGFLPPIQRIWLKQQTGLQAGQAQSTAPS